MKKFAILQKTEVVTVSLLSLVLFLRMFSIFLVLPVFNILAQEVKYANFFLVALAFFLRCRLCSCLESHSFL